MNSTGVTARRERLASYESDLKQLPVFQAFSDYGLRRFFMPCVILANVQLGLSTVGIALALGASLSVAFCFVSSGIGKSSMKDALLFLYDMILHMDTHLAELSTSMGAWLYGLLALIVFAETGLVVTPFLPGDSLLFAIGALVAIPESGLSFPFMLVILLAAAILGDAVNYAIGRSLGPRIFKSETSWLLNKGHLMKAQAFYEKYGGKAIFLARFLPVVRTFAPFVAGVGKMNYAKFWGYNVSGAICWVFGFLGAGYLFGNTEIVKKYFQIVIFGIIFVSLIPIAVEWYLARRQSTVSGGGKEAEVE